MVTTVNRETESTVVVAAPVVEPAANVDVSAIPETPAELLKQWDSPKRSMLMSIPSAIVSFLCSLSGPGMTDQDRVRREIAENNGYARRWGPHV